MLSRYRKWRTAKVSGAIRLRFKVPLVKKVPLFVGLSDPEIRQIARLVNELEVPAGTRLATAGQPGGEFLAIVKGEAAVTTRSGRTAVLRTGDFFGEMSLIDGQPRSATVQANTPMRLLVLDQQDFRRLVGRTTSIALKIMQTLSRRLRAAEGDVVPE
jgi:CRP/FNR family transcriptional regulator, cyclic AMP receptor protein